MTTPEDLTTLRKLLAKDWKGIEPPQPRLSQSFGLWVLNRWRATGRFCCIELHSDYDFVWDIWWARGYDLSKPMTERNPGGKHRLYKLVPSFEKLEEAIIEGALAAFEISGADQVMEMKRARTRVT